MKAYRSFLIISAFTISSLSLVVSSCKEDEPPSKPKLSFDKSSMSVNEADGEIEVKIKLDKPTPERFFISYELDGTAKDKVNAASNPYDYEIKEDYLEAKIDKDDTVAIIKIELSSDFEIEDPETILISIKSVDSENIEITREDDIKITINQEDGVAVVLAWPAQTATGKADMDLILRAGANTSTWDGVLNASIQESYASPEFIFIPKVVDFKAYGLSFIYYDGNFDPLNFTSTFIDVVNGTLEAANQRQSFNGKYTITNINKWTDINTSIVVQTFEKVGTEFKNISNINTPASSSRAKTPSIFSINELKLKRKNENQVKSKLSLKLIDEFSLLKD